MGITKGDLIGKSIIEYKVEKYLQSKAASTEAKSVLTNNWLECLPLAISCSSQDICPSILETLVVPAGFQHLG